MNFENELAADSYGALKNLGETLNKLQENISESIEKAKDKDEIKVMDVMFPLVLAALLMSGSMDTAKKLMERVSDEKKNEADAKGIAESLTSRKFNNNS